MALILTEEQMMVRDNARAFLADKAPVAHLRKLRDTRDADGFSRSLWKAFAEMGFCGLLLPESLGGSGLGYIEGGVIMEEIGRNLTPSPFLSTALLGATALLRDGNGARNEELLPKLAAGDLLLALAASMRPAPLRSKRSAAATASRSAARNASSPMGTLPSFSSLRRAAPARRARPTASRSFSSTPRRRGSTLSAP